MNITNTQSGGTINLTKDYACEDGFNGDGITISGKKITINGNGHTIDAQGKARIFYLDNGAELIIENLNIINGKTSKGGAIYLDKSNLSLNNSNLTNNTATNEKGGAIYNDEGTIKITNSRFEKNPQYDRAIYNYARADNRFRLTIINTTLIEDKVCVNYDDRERRLDDKRDIDLLTTEFSVDIPEINYGETPVPINVAGIDTSFNGSVTVNITNTQHNTEVKITNGEGNDILHLEINKFTARFKNFISLTENAFENDNTKPYLEIDFKVIEYNSFSALYEDILKSTNNITLNQDYLYDTRTDTDHIQGINITDKTFTIYGNGHIINGNNAGRIFYIEKYSDVIIENLILKNGKGQSISTGGSNYDVGGAIYLSQSNLTIINSKFTNNKAKNDGEKGRGGAIYSTSNSILNITKSEFTDNIAPTANSLYIIDGKSVYILDSAINQKDIANLEGDYQLAPITIVNTNLILNIPSYVQGDKAILSITEPKDFTGIINLTINNSPKDNIQITNGKASINLNLNPGTYTATIINQTEYYSDPDRNLTCIYQAVTPTSTQFTVKYSTKFEIKNIPDFTEGSSVELVVYEKNKYTGLVKVSIGTETYTILLNNGIGKKTVKPKTLGKCIARINFSGNEKYIASTAISNTFKVTSYTKIVANKKTFKLKDKNKKYTITLKDQSGKIIKKAKVTLKVKNRTYIAKTNDKGVATFKLTKLNKKGTYTATINYNGDDKYKKSNKKVKLTVKKS